MIVLGSLHFSLAEFGRLFRFCAGSAGTLISAFDYGQSDHPSLTTKIGYTAIIEQFGGTITVETCILATPMLLGKVKTLMINSAKYAYYAPELLGTRIIYGDLTKCEHSAISGRIERDDTLWQM